MVISGDRTADWDRSPRHGATYRHTPPQPGAGTNHLSPSILAGPGAATFCLKKTSGGSGRGDDHQQLEDFLESGGLGGHVMLVLRVIVNIWSNFCFLSFA